MRDTEIEGWKNMVRKTDREKDRWKKIWTNIAIDTWVDLEINRYIDIEMDR
jgi:hypothetical protein